MFNYRLSRTRRVVENAFGVLSSVFRVLRKPLLLQPERAQVVIMATIRLHNFNETVGLQEIITLLQLVLIWKKMEKFESGDWRQENEQVSLLPLRSVARRSKVTAEKIRDDLAKYFSTSGAVHWQDKYA